MDLLAWMLVGKPHVILLVAVTFVAGHLALRYLWRGLVLLRTSEANIRVDLLLIWPMLFLLSAWSLLRRFR
jgi:hypothetical protein